MAAGFGLQLAVKDYALHVCRALNACEKPHELEQILRSLLLVVRVSENSSNIDSASTNSNPPGDVKQSYTRVLRETEKPQNAKHILEAALCQHMESISFSLLPGKGACHSCLTQSFAFSPGFGCLNLMYDTSRKALIIQDNCHACSGGLYSP